MFNLAPLHPPSGIFNLEGTFLGFLRQGFDQPESIVLEVEEEEIAIDLPANFSQTSQSSWRQSLQPGDRIHCIGRSQLNLQAGVVNLRAYQFFTSDRGSAPYLD